MPLPRIKNIIFDLGNTLVYYDYSYFYDGLYRLERNLNPNKLKRFYLEKDLGNKLCKSKLKHKNFFKILKKKFDLKTGYSDFTRLYCDIFWENTNMKNLLEKLSKNKKCKLFLLSNTDPKHIKFVDKNFPYISLLKKRVLSFKTGMIKPDRKIFIYTLNKYKLLPEETLLIDDLKKNVVSARSLGINSIHYTTHRSFLKQFGKYII